MDVKKCNRWFWFVLCVLFTSFSFNSYLCLAFGTISANQSLSGDQTISSETGKFILGFFNPGNSTNYYIGIWYDKVSPLTVIWVANRESPILDKYTSNLRISNGNLVLLNENGALVWSANLNSTNSSSTVQGVLLDDGNLVLRDGSILIWQSFDDPTDTWLPGMKLGINKVTKKVTRLTSWRNNEDPAPGLFSVEQDPNGTSQFYILRNKSRIIWTSGDWNGQTSTLGLNHINNFSYIDNKNESYFTYSLYNTSALYRFMISVGGQIEQLSWVDSAKQWALFWTQPRIRCDAYAYCGEFGICNKQGRPWCQCLSGFHPRSANEWNSEVYSAGCTRKASLKCGNSTSVNGKSDRFLATHLSLPSNPLTRITTFSNDQECKSACLNNCSCTAYAYYDSSCSLWSEALLNLQQLAQNESTGKTLFIRLAASEFPSSNNKKTMVFAVTGASLIMLLFVGLVAASILRRRRMRKIGKISRSMCEIGGGGQKDAQLVLFSFKSILAATNKFSETNKLGEGGFGPVYKGNLLGDQQVAIKRLSKKSGQGLEEFMNELKLIANLQHKNLVRLLGCCVESEESILIYEYMPNRSLDKFLFDPYEKAKLVWDIRFKIVEGVAQGLLYIHKFSRLKIIHRDLKASNVLLDEAMNPKISDFGMARIFGINQTEANTNRVVGTYGYMSPEYAFFGQFSEKSDVFSFGVFLLEIVSGRRNTSFHRSGLSLTLLSWAWELWKEGKETQLIDASIEDTCCLKETVKCIHVGLLCVQEDPIDRPTMALVILMLTTNAQTLPTPKEPAFHSRKAVDCSSEIPEECSNNDLTVSLPTGR